MGDFLCILGWPQTGYVVEDGLELLVFLHLPPEFWNYRREPLCLVNVVLGMEPQPSHMPDKQSTSWIIPSFNILMKDWNCLGWDHYVTGSSLSYPLASVFHEDRDCVSYSILHPQLQL